MSIIKTTRLILRPWRQEDYEPFAALNADPRVMEYFPKLLTREESDERIQSWQKFIEENGCGFWAVSVPGVSEFIGFIGINKVPFTAHFTPAIEIGWRLAFDYWGKGYATEGAKAALEYGFEVLGTQLRRCLSPHQESFPFIDSHRDLACRPASAGRCARVQRQQGWADRLRRGAARMAGA